MRDRNGLARAGKGSVRRLLVALQSGIADRFQLWPIDGLIEGDNSPFTFRIIDFRIIDSN
jgi:hypothetical protein